MAHLKIRMDVPLVPQARNSSCWYAAVCMVSYYREAGPRLGMPKVWQENKGISIAQESTLARNEGLTAFPLPTSKSFTEANLYAALKQAGPLWCAGNWDGEGAHIIVLTGLQDGEVYFNDPWPVDKGIKDDIRPIDWFNKWLDWSDPNTVLYRAA